MKAHEEQQRDSGDSMQARMELELVMSAVGCSVRKAITRWQHEQNCLAGISFYGANLEQLECNAESLEHSLQAALTRMNELAETIQQALDQKKF